MSRIYFVISSLCIIFYVNASLYYRTPALDDQFQNFEITERTRVRGSEVSEEAAPQNALGIYNRQLLTFNFMGKGNALLYFQEKEGVENTNSFTVEIGGGSNYDRVAIYNLTLHEFDEPLTKTTVYEITSDKENRSYWIHWDIIRQSVSVGVCLNPNKQEILRYSPILSYNISHIYISTSRENNGSWEFPSDSDLLGGCDPLTPKCPFGINCDDVFESKTRSTCIDKEAGPYFLGNAICPYICNGNVLCANINDCESGLCEAPKTTAQPVTTETSAIIQSILPTTVSSEGTKLSSEFALNTTMKSSTPAAYSTMAMSCLSQTKTISASLQVSLVTLATRTAIDTATPLVTTHSTINPFKSDHSVDIGKVVAIAAGGSAAALGGAAIIYLLVSRCNPSVILPTALSTDGNGDDETQIALSS